MEEGFTGERSCRCHDLSLLFETSGKLAIQCKYQRMGDPKSSFKIANNRDIQTSILKPHMNKGSDMPLIL